MVQILCFILPPTIAVLIGAVLKRRRRAAAFVLGEWLGAAAAIYMTTAIVLLPFDRATADIAWNGMGGALLYIRYGSSAMAFAGVLGMAAGVLSARLDARWQLEERKTPNRPAGRSLFGALVVHALVLVLLLLTFSYIWARSNYGDIEFGEIVFNLNMPLVGTASSLLESYARNALIPTALSFALFELLVHAPARHAWRAESKKHGKLWIQLFPLRLPFSVAMLGVLIWFVFLLSCADSSFKVMDYFASQMRQSKLIEEEYVDPDTVAITFPEEKKNLITIYVESCETSSQDRANGGFFEVNYIPEMTRIAQRNVSFSQSGLIEGAAVAPACGWTIAGLVAQSSGLPLKMYSYDDQVTDNAMEAYAAFMPGATTMGDILKGAGYRTVFMAGSDFSFGGRRQYYTQHGEYEILDLLTARERGVIPQEYNEGWGFEDRKLYSWAKEELTLLAAQEQPFHFAMLTADTHMPDGYLCPLCPDIYEERYANVLACASSQLGEFLDWCAQQPFYEDTVIAVTGDHASMVAGFYEEEAADKHNGTTDRNVYNAFINSAEEPVKETNRQFTTLDFFPTTLASLGVEIEGERLGLGTNLFSDVPTLAEEYGYEAFFEELNLKSLFYDETILYP